MTSDTCVPAPSTHSSNETASPRSDGAAVHAYGSVRGPLIEIVPPEQTTLPVPLGDDDQLEIHFAERIDAAWRQAVNRIIEAGHILIEAKAALPHGRFLAMVRHRLGMSEDTAERLMKIARDQWIRDVANSDRARNLPASWTILHRITSLNVADRERLLQVGCIRADMRRADIEEAIRQVERERNPDDSVMSEQPRKSNRAPRSIFDRVDTDVENIPSPESAEPELAPDEAYAILLDLARLVVGHAVRTGNGKVYGFSVRGDEARVFDRLLAQARAIIRAADSGRSGDT